MRKLDIRCDRKTVFSQASCIDRRAQEIANNRVVIWIDTNTNTRYLLRSQHQ